MPGITGILIALRNTGAKFNLHYPRPELSDRDAETVRTIKQSPFWLIVHGGDEPEILELVNYALEMREIEMKKVQIVLISPHGITTEEFLQYDFYPASVLSTPRRGFLPAVDLNAMKEARSFGEKHYFIPFERRL